MKPAFLLSILIPTLFAASLPLPLAAADIHLAQGLLAGEASATSVILQTRLTAAPVQFVLTSCHNHAFFQHGDKNSPPAKPEDRALGYPALEPIIRLNPDFVIINGDCVYYDHPWNARAKTQAELRKKWHEQYVMPRFVKLFAQTPTYWLKDDHDHRYNDSDTTGDMEPSNKLGIATFREQVPVVDPEKPKAPTYRTHRMGRDLQLWFVEGRDHRSPNEMPDGPDKPRIRS